MKKPVRHVRRFFRRRMQGKGKGRGGRRVSGKGITAYTMNLSEHEYEHVLWRQGKRQGQGPLQGQAI
eukprot:5779801-Lingulodinium_polyedra.AAC.1